VIIAGVFVGLAFQAKMIEAWAILPAFGLAYLVAAPGPLGRRTGRLAIAGAVTIAVSLSWMTAVTLVPAADRPYVDGSRHDSVYEQVFVYNGVARFGNTAFGLGSGVSYRPSATAIAFARRVGTSQSPSADTSPRGVARLVTGEVGRDAGWLLPVALAAAIGLLIARRHRPRTDIVRAAALLWGGWLITFAVLFSSARVLLTYYTGVLVPPIAALSAIGLRALYRSLRRADARRWPSVVMFAVGAVSVGVLCWRTPAWFAGLTAALIAAGIVSLAASTGDRAPLRTVAAFLALLIGPAAATIALVANGGASFDAPFAPGGTLANPVLGRAPRAVAAYGGVVSPQMTTMRWQMLDQDRETYRTLLSPNRRLVVFTSAQASHYVLAGIPFVQPIGGYSGLVDAPTLDAIRGELDAHQIAYAVVPGPGDLRASDPRIQLIEARCTNVNGRTVGASPAGAQLYACP
jgi:4-amino-4-deoxy-L-arabinose transferase-like glycosyltransferase